MDHYTRIQLAIEYLEHHLQDDFNIRETSAVCELFGVSFSAFISGDHGIHGTGVRAQTQINGSCRDAAGHIGRHTGHCDELWLSISRGIYPCISAYFGMTPAKLRKVEVDQLSLLKMQQSIDFNDYRTRLDGTFHMNTPRLVTREPNWIVGYEYKTNLNDNQHYAEIPGFYHDFGMEQKFMAIPERTRPDMAYGVACRF